MAAAAKKATVTPITPKVDEKNKSKAYGAAVAKLRATYRDEFNRYLDEAYKEFGLEVKRRPTPEEAAEKKRLHDEGVAARKKEREDTKAAKAAAVILEKRRKLEAELAALPILPVDLSVPDEGDPQV